MAVLKVVNKPLDSVEFISVIPIFPIRNGLSLPGFELRNLKSKGQEVNLTAITAHYSVTKKKLRVFRKGFLS